MRERVLVVEDDPYVQRYLRRALTNDGYIVTLAGTGNDALHMVKQEPPAVVLLDVLLPDIDGVILCGRLRAMTSAIIIMVTARTDVETRIASLDLGADDYVTKPFVLGELLARMRALLRRYRANGATRLHVADIELDPVERTVNRGARLISLTPKEFDVLVVLMRHPGRVIDRASLFAEAWPDEPIEGSNTVQVHVHHLREKIHGPGEAPLLHTMRRAGYVLRRVVEQHEEIPTAQ